jgi:acetoin utilization deacetylase AcuC-like enzyme
MALIYIYDDVYMQHETGDHPENKFRLNAINDAIDRVGIEQEMIKVAPREAAREDLLRVHGEAHIEKVLNAFEKGETYLDPDTVVSPGSAKAALMSAGAGLAAADEIMSGKAKTAFCSVRPPGHHAEPDVAMGFCLFNNIAVTARYLQEKHNLEKILILDWDVHHGNGTEKAFYEDDSVYYISLHQYPFYPGTGSLNDTGNGKGLGYNKNYPMPAGTGDEQYLETFNEGIVPILKDYKPDFILLSAGFDAHERDRLASIELSSPVFGDFTKIIKEASESADGRIISFLEGGYELNALAASVVCHLREL